MAQVTQPAAGLVEPSSALDALAAASRALAEGADLAETLEAVVEAVASAVGATTAIARIVDLRDGELCARAVVSSSPAVAALLEGSRLPSLAFDAGELDETGALPDALREAASASGARAVLALPVLAGGRLLGSLELLRPNPTFGPAERSLARLGADQVAVAVRAFEGIRREGDADERALDLAGGALAAGGDATTTAEEVVRVAAQATGALAGVLWGADDDGLRPLATWGGEAPDSVAAAFAEEALEGVSAPRVDSLGGHAVVTLPVGRTPRHALQLVYVDEAVPGRDELGRLALFGVRAAHALEAAQRAGEVARELERARALLGLVARADEQLSLAHTLETALDRVTEVVGADRVGVYLREDGRLLEAATRGLVGPHALIAERLLELALGPFRGRGAAVVSDARGDHLGGLRAELAETGIAAAVGVPLLVANEVVGLLAVYPSRRRAIGENEIALLSALAARVAVSVQNARLHEQATQLGAELEQVLALERQAARRLRALYEVSRSFAQSLSLERTLEAVARTAVELLDADAAVIAMPDERGELLLPLRLHVGDARLGEAIRAVLSQPERLDALPRRELLRGKAIVLDPRRAARLGPPYELLVPFLEKGSTAVLVPIATPTELLGTLKLLSIDPARRLAGEAVELALSLAGQAALALDNARLYQHQKRFTDTMQRSLLPRVRPHVAGLEIGDVYESSARVDVGGDLYDFLLLKDGRLAVVVGDVTGHGVEAAADMAMAKFVFRSLAREHPEPGDFLSAANEVVHGEIGAGKFITMVYLTVDSAGRLGCASAGHPRPRIVHPDGTVVAVETAGLALGIEAGQAYAATRAELPPGAAVVLYTDGVVEARREGEQYGLERLDAVLAEGRELTARELAAAVLADCHGFGGGELADDCAVVVIRRASA